MRGNKDIPIHTIDDYLAIVPVKERVVLEKLRQQIRAAAPKAEELISYQIPAFKLNGMLVGFAMFKQHCGFYVMSHAVMKEFREELKGYDTATATIRFAVEKPLPAALVKRIVKARMRENEGMLRARELKKKK